MKMMFLETVCSVPITVTFGNSANARFRKENGGLSNYPNERLVVLQRYIGAAVSCWFLATKLSQVTSCNKTLSLSDHK